ncbi:MAG: prepilin peptidase, partial [Ilumatobacteraceae bacterium]|nr:prepilin peptidase [Ilumatobacteraceae bacterium]
LAAIALAALTAAAAVDASRRRLPDELVGLGALALVPLLFTEHRSGVVLGAVLLAGPVLALHLASPERMGFGDVKAAAVLGGVVGLVDPVGSLVVLCLGAGSAAAWGLARRVPDVALGPFLVTAGAVVVVGSTFGPVAP